MSDVNLTNTERERGIDFIKRLEGAWDCCATCAGGLLADRDARVRAAALAPIQALHQPVSSVYSGKFCSTCHDVVGDPKPWPCDTAAALAAAGVDAAPDETTCADCGGTGGEEVDHGGDRPLYARGWRCGGGGGVRAAAPHRKTTQGRGGCGGGGGRHSSWAGGCF